MIIKQVNGRMQAEENTTNTRLEIGARLVAFQEVHTSTCDKLIVLHSEYQGLQYEYGGLQDKYPALNERTSKTSKSNVSNTNR